jgi:hypothetical protein
MAAWADTYTLTDGTRINGEPISVNENGVVFHSADGTDIPRVAWDNLTQESIRLLVTKVKTPRDRALIEPLVEEPQQAKAERKEITVHPIEPPVRPKTGLGVTAVFGSPVGLTILLVLYCATIFAAFEVAVYRRRPKAMVCGLAAIPFLGVLSPIIFISLPTIKGQSEAEIDSAQTRFVETAPPSDAATAAPPEDIPGASQAQAAPAAVYTPPPVAAALPEPTVFRRGEFSFNRRFFETKLAGFFRLVPGEAEKDLVVLIKSSRGNFIGKRITNITPAELYLQVFHDNATADEMIPFIEVLEVQIRHKDLA